MDQEQFIMLRMLLWMCCAMHYNAISALPV